MDNAILQELSATIDPAEKAAIVAESVLGKLPEETALVARRCVVLHWFDQQIIEALLPEDTAKSAGEVYEHLASLPFVESVPQGLAYHDLTREALLNRYAVTQPALITTAAKLAAPIYQSKGESARFAGESFFCYTVAGASEAAIEILDKLLIQTGSRQDWQSLVNVLQLQDEAEALPFVDPLPRTTWQWIAHGITRADEIDLTAAVADFDEAVEFDPDSADAYIGRGIARFAQGDLAPAIADFDKAVELNPDDAYAYTFRGIARRTHGDLGAAMADFDKAVELNPEQGMWARIGLERFLLSLSDRETGRVRPSTEFALTKIVAPRRRPDLLDRPRLLDFLEKNAHRRLILVSAPAGYGKTSLLIDFVSRLDHPVCWYATAESDRNLWTFVRYIVGAIQRQFPGFGERSVRLVDQETHDHDALVTTLVNELHALRSPLTLIIDDFHLVEEAPEIKGFMESLISVLPDHCHLVIASRTIPDFDPETIHNLGASGEVIGLGHEELRFTPEEIQAFLQHSYDYAVSLNEAQELAEVSEGWITAIILTAQAGDPLSGINRARSAGGRLYDYLATEVLDLLSSHMRDFLLESSVLSEMEPGVVNALLDIQDADVILGALEEQNIFLTRLEEGRGEEGAAKEPRVWYRYHSLFREFLQTRLRERNPQRYRGLQQRAAHVLWEAGYWGQAIDHLLEAGAYEQAADAIEEETRGVLTAVKVDRLVQWIDALPSEVLERHPRLLRHRARFSIDRDGDPGRAVKLIERAESLLERDRESTQLAYTLLDKATALRIQGRLSEAIACGEQAMELAGEEEPVIGADAHRTIGLAQSELGRLDEAVAAFRTALDYWQSTDNLANRGVLHNDLGMALHRAGHLSASEFHFQKALEIWDELKDVSRAVLALNNLASVYHDHGKYNEALKRYRRAMEGARESGSRRYGAYILIGMGDVYRDLGRYSDAVEVYKQGLLDARKIGDAFLGTYGLDALGQTYHLMGKTSDGIALVRRAYEDARERGAEYEMALYQLSLGAIAHEQGFLDDATSRLKHCLEYFQQGHLPELTKTNLHLAQTHHLAYRPQEMRECIRIAELCLFRLGYDGFILPTLLRTADAIRAGADVSSYLKDLLEQAEERFGPALQATQRLPSPPLRVHMLGEPRVYLGEAPLKNEDWSRQRVQELFFYLLTHPRRMTREIGEDLWPNLPSAKVINNLYVTISRLRRALDNPDYIVTEAGHYSLRIPQLWVDVHEFRDAIELAKSSPDVWEEIQYLERAVSLYQGDFLKNFSVASSDSWIYRERTEHRRLYEGALKRLVNYWTEQGDHGRARRYAELRSEFIERVV